MGKSPQAQHVTLPVNVVVVLDVMMVPDKEINAKLYATNSSFMLCGSNGTDGSCTRQVPFEDHPTWTTQTLRPELMQEDQQPPHRPNLCRARQTMGPEPQSHQSFRNAH